MSRKWLYITLALFTAGNASWDYYDIEKLFWIPLAIALSALVIYAMKVPKEASVWDKGFLGYFYLLAMGHILKQGFYVNGASRKDDYLWGAACTLGLIVYFAWHYFIQRKKNKKWEARKPTSGKKH